MAEVTSSKCPQNGPLQKAKSDNVFGQARKTGENVPGRPVRPRFHQRSADAGDAEPRHAGVCRPARLDDRPAGPRGRLRCGEARSPRETAGGRPPPGDRCRAGVAAGPLGPVGNGSAGDPPGTGASRRRLRLADRGAGSDHASRSRHGRRCWPSSPSSKERFCGNELGLAWPMPGRTANGWAGRQPRPCTLRKSGNYIAPASANPRSPAGCRSAAPRSAASWQQSDEEAPAEIPSGRTESTTKPSSMPTGRKSRR